MDVKSAYPPRRSLREKPTGLWGLWNRLATFIHKMDESLADETI
jgi:hypothetical protein